MQICNYSTESGGKRVARDEIPSFDQSEAALASLWTNMMNPKFFCLASKGLLGALADERQTLEKKCCINY